MYKRITKSLSHHIDSALRLHFSRRNERVPAEVCPVVYFAGIPVAIAISVRLRLCPPKPSASLHPGASRHPFTWPWAAMGSGGHSLQPSSFRFDCIDSPECALSSLLPVFLTCNVGMKIGIPRRFSSGRVTLGICQTAFQALLWHNPVFPTCNVRMKIDLLRRFSSGRYTLGIA